MATLAQGDEREETPETIPVIQFKLLLGDAREKALEDRLNHVLRAFLPKNTAVEVVARQSDQPAGVLIHHKRGRGLIAGADAC